MYTCFKYFSICRLSVCTTSLCGHSIAKRVVGIHSFKLQYQSIKRETMEEEDASLFFLESNYLSSSWQTSMETELWFIFSFIQSLHEKICIYCNQFLYRQSYTDFILDICEKNCLQNTMHTNLYKKVFFSWCQKPG